MAVEKPLRARDLDVYKRAFRCAVALHKLAYDWPKFEVYGGLADQIRRSSRSICANLAEGLAKNGPLEQRRFLGIAIGSAEEVIVWLEFAHAFGYVEREVFQEFQGEYEEIVKMLGGLMARRADGGR